MYGLIEFSGQFSGIPSHVELDLRSRTAPKMKFSINDYLSKWKPLDYGDKKRRTAKHFTLDLA